MKPIDQTIFNADEGNCFAACVASLLELPLDAVPNFCADKSRNEEGWLWYESFIRWLNERGWTAVGLTGLGRASQDLAPAYCIASGPAARGHDHATIYRFGKLVHDPHPSRAGLESVKEWLFLLPLDPAGGVR